MRTEALQNRGMKGIEESESCPARKERKRSAVLHRESLRRYPFGNVFATPGHELNPKRVRVGDVLFGLPLHQASRLRREREGFEGNNRSRRHSLWVYSWSFSLKEEEEGREGRRATCYFYEDQPRLRTKSIV